jgi:2-oxoglutarate ferredoxin oxidoreductase subunit beta
MSPTLKPILRHPDSETNRLGLTRRDYEGAMSTLCAGCGHDSVTAALVQSFFEMDIEPHRAIKMSGIGCSAKTPTYFMSEAHGFNGVHGRMPALATGAHAANSELLCIGVSGDGDSLSIGLGQFCHAIRRNTNMLYVLENNGVYGLTKGQFSASADVGTKSKRGEINTQEPIDPVLLALSLGATFVGRSFSGDKEHLIPLIKAGLTHNGFAFLDVISPCVTFNNHEGSTKSYLYTREHYTEVAPVDFVPVRDEIASGLEEGTTTIVPMHDGSQVRFKHVGPDWDPTDPAAAWNRYRELTKDGSVVTGLLYIAESSQDFHTQSGTVDGALVDLPYEDLCPGSDALSALMDEHR